MNWTSELQSTVSNLTQSPKTKTSVGQDQAYNEHSILFEGDSEC